VNEAGTVDKDTLICIIGAIVLLMIFAYIAVLAWKTAKQAPPTLVDKLPDILRHWRDARSNGERALIVMAVVGTALRRGGQFVVALGVIGACVSGFAAVCSGRSVELLKIIREILRDILYALGKPTRQLPPQ